MPFDSLMKPKSRSKSRKRPMHSIVENHPIADSINIKVFSSEMDDGRYNEPEQIDDESEDENELLAFYARKFQSKSLV